MDHLPFWLPVLFLATTLTTVFLLFRAGHSSIPLLITLVAWLLLQGAVSLSGFYQVSKGSPPRFAGLLFPPLLLIAALFGSRRGRGFIFSFDPALLTLLHVVRIPVEITLYGLFLYKAVPREMTFEGRNFDILCGLTAPWVFYSGWVNKRLKPELLLAWNIGCLLLLLNVVVTALLSAPFDFQQLAFDQPNIALLYFPYTLLPALIVPAVLFSHLVLICRLARKEGQHP